MTMLALRMAAVAAATERELDRLLPPEDGPLGRLGQAMRYATLGGGKRFRPLLVAATADLGDADPAAVTRIGATIELVHAYSLIHDDLPAMDDATLRRGKPACHKAFGEGEAILVTDRGRPVAELRPLTSTPEALDARLLDRLAQGACRDAPEDRDLDEVVRMARARPPDFVVGEVLGPERPGLHVFAGEVPFALERPQMVVDPVRAANAEVIADLAQGRRKAPAVDRGRQPGGSDRRT